MNSFPISHFNGVREEDELVIYTGHGSTKTNCYGLEAVVSGSRVIRFGSNDNEIPEDGFVISGHGKGADFVRNYVCEGALITVDEKTMTLTSELDRQALMLCNEKKEAILKERLAERIAEGKPFRREQAEALLHSLREAIDDSRFDFAKHFAEEAYYCTAASKKDEIRAIWHRPHEHSDAEAEQTILRFRDAGFTQLLVETDYEGFSNALKLKHDYLPVSRQYMDGFDPIDALIRAGKKYGVEIHAWFENFFYGVEYLGCKMKELHPEWMARTKSGGWVHDAYDIFYFLNPAIKEVREHLLNHIRELLDNYDFDGFQLDYIRYPIMHGIDHCAGFDDYTRQAFLQETGIDAAKITDEYSPEMKKFTEWRASFVTEYVKNVYELIRSYREKGRMIKLSTAVFGDPEEAIRLKCQDWRTWVRNGWLDAIYPMAYLHDAEDVGKEVAYMVENYGEAPNISGIAPMFNGLPMLESTKQVEQCRKAGAAGIAFFATGNCTDEQLDKLKIGVFRER